MSEIPAMPQQGEAATEIAYPRTPEGMFAKLQVWFADQAALAQLKVKEVLSRKDLASFYFPSPEKGTNRIDLGGGFDLKLVHKYNIKVDVEAVDAVTPQQIKKLKLPWDDLFKYEPTLVTAVYNELSAEQKKFVDQLLDIKDATPSLEIVKNANYEASTAHAEAANAAKNEELGINEVQNPDDAQPGDYYEDGDGQWWHVLPDGEWEECANPRQAAAKPKRAPRARKPKAGES